MVSALQSSVRSFAKILVPLALVSCQSSPAPSATAAPAGSITERPIDPNARRIDIEANATGFSPSSVTVKKGESVTLRFTRTTPSECLKAIEFPSLKIKRDLPLNTPVEIPIRAEQAGEIKYQCWMAMVFGKLVVE